MSWNVVDLNGVAGAALSIDGRALPLSMIDGPLPTASGVTYAGVFGSLSPGTSHSYTITATDKLGYSSQLDGTFTVPAAPSPNAGTNGQRTGSAQRSLMAAAAALASLTFQRDYSAKLDSLCQDPNSVEND
jgi:hypothetical protein